MRVSVICPVYNTPPTLLAESIASVLQWPDARILELILVDDASTSQDTINMIYKILAGDCRIKLVRNVVNQGPAVARNVGAKEALGDWLAFFDSDDIWVPEKISRAHQIVTQYPDARWISGNLTNLFLDGSRTQAPHISQACIGERLSADTVRIKSPELTRCLIANSWLSLAHQRRVANDKLWHIDLAIECIVDPDCKFLA